MQNEMESGIFDKTYTRAELEAAVCAALENCARGFDNLYWGLHSNKEAADCVRALIPADGQTALDKHDVAVIESYTQKVIAQIQGRSSAGVPELTEALDKLLTQARLKEAEWWHKIAEVNPDPILAENKRIAALRAASSEPGHELKGQ
jgi:hypothetical protein